MNTACVLPDETTRVAAATGDCPRAISVLLTCTDATAVDRLRRREVGGGYDRHIVSSRQMAAELVANADDITHLIATDCRNVASVAADVLARTGWLA